MQLQGKQMRSKRTGYSVRRQHGWFLAETLVSLAVGITFLLAVIGVFVNSSLSFAELGNYINMDRKSRNALDHMTANIRNAKLLVGYDPAVLTFKYDAAGTTNLTYRYDSATGLVTEEWTTGGNTTTKTLLTGCQGLTFSLLDRDLVSTTTASSGKVISVAWNCLGTAVGRTNTESMRQSQIVIRNQP